jgi:hypothetical protein
VSALLLVAICLLGGCTLRGPSFESRLLVEWEPILTALARDNVTVCLWVVRGDEAVKLYRTGISNGLVTCDHHGMTVTTIPAPMPAEEE